MTTHHPHYSKASIGGHPIHAMLVGFPIAFYVGGIISVIAYASTHDPFWYRVGMVLLFAGVAGAALAAVFGAIDLFAGIPRNTPAKRTGYIHAGLNVASLLLFLGAALALWSGWRDQIYADSLLPYGLPLVLGIIGVVTTGAAGFFGWKLVQTHHVGIDESSTEVTDVPARGEYVGTRP